MTQILREIHRLLSRHGLTLAVAESCTGGLLSEALTRLPGSSAYFLLGVVAYSNQAKQEILGTPAKTLGRYGAVSAPIARSMAEKARKKGRCDIGIGITGIAGPSGGTPAKPVGTVFIALKTADRLLCKRFCFSGSRSGIRRQTVIAALKLLLQQLPKTP